ncbi:MAG: hypothetical protein AAF621_00445 [Pseudomonadota bacterium]
MSLETQVATLITNTETLTSNVTEVMNKITGPHAIMGFHQGIFCTSAGTGNNYELTSQIDVTELTVGDIFRFISDKENGVGDVLIKLDDLTSIALNTNAGKVFSGMIRSGNVYDIVYNGTEFILINPSDMRPQTLYPKLYGADVEGTPNYVYATGEYKCVGDLLYFSFGMEWDSLGSAAGAMRVGLYTDIARTIPLEFTPSEYQYLTGTPYYEGLSLAAGQVLGMIINDTSDDIMVTVADQTGVTYPDETALTDAGKLHFNGIFYK